jgi:hypothetical protein
MALRRCRAIHRPESLSALLNKLCGFSAGKRAIMLGQSVIVWDLETVPDLGGFAAANEHKAIRISCELRPVRTQSLALSDRLTHCW